MWLESSQRIDLLDPSDTSPPAINRYTPYVHLSFQLHATPKNDLRVNGRSSPYSFGRLGSSCAAEKISFPPELSFDPVSAYHGQEKDCGNGMEGLGRDHESRKVS
jgi:hypothetical protein